jgi:hypothetical protein
MSIVAIRVKLALLQELRTPARLLPTLGLPVMILAFFYLPYVQDSALDATLQTGGIVVLALTISFIYSLSVKLAQGCCQQGRSDPASQASVSAVRGRFLSGTGLFRVP